MNDIIVIEDPKKKNKQNFYLNEFNYFNKNNIKMRRQKVNYFSKLYYQKKFEKIKHPMPKMLYATSGLVSQSQNVKKSIEQFKENIEAFNNIINLTSNLDLFAGMNEENKESAQDFDNNISKNKIVDECSQNLFITKTDETTKSQLENELRGVKLSNTSEIYNQEQVNEIRQNSKSLRSLEIFKKYPQTLSSFDSNKDQTNFTNQKYNSEDGFRSTQKTVEEKYVDYRRKINNPNMFYSKIDSFSQKMNMNLGEVSSSYGKVRSKERFVKNPILTQYFDMVPIYDMYKDIKSIENRYAHTKYKFRLLPLVNNKKRNLDKLADRLYKMNHIQKGLENIFPSSSPAERNENMFETDGRAYSQQNIKPPKRAFNINKGNPKLFQTYRKDLKIASSKANDRSNPIPKMKELKKKNINLELTSKNLTCY